MIEYNYKPKYYKCKLISLKQESINTKFLFEDLLNKELYCILVNESLERVKEKINNVKLGEFDKTYLSYGMRDINLSMITDNTWQLFDEYNIYEFKM